jgi:hypothetical protein
MKFLFRIAVLALAAVGARTLFERIRPRVCGATGTGTVIGETRIPERDGRAGPRGRPRRPGLTLGGLAGSPLRVCAAR